MPGPVRKPTVEDIYGEGGVEEDEMAAKLNQTLSPRSPSMLFDAMAGLGVTAGDLVLDIGCGLARHACELARRFGCRVVGVDLVADRVKGAQDTVAEAGLAERVTVMQGTIEAIPLAAATCDFLWCRDMLNHVSHLRQGIMECARVLRPHGGMLVYHTVATDLLEPQEARRLYEAQAIVPANMSPVNVENAFRDAGLQILSRDAIGSEWREYWEEGEEKTTSNQLLRLARMRRARDWFVTELGRIPYDAELANCHWGVYQMLGKLCPTMYTLRKTAGISSSPSKPPRRMARSGNRGALAK